MTVDPWTHDEHLHCTTWIADQAIASLERRDPTRPCYLQVGFHRPHMPLDPPMVWWERFRHRDLPPVPVGDWAIGMAAAGQPAGMDPRDLDDARRAYFATIAHVDAQIGRHQRRRACRPGHPRVPLLPRQPEHQRQRAGALDHDV